MQSWDAYLELVLPPFLKQTALAWFEQAEALHLTFALVQTVDDLFRCPQLEARDLLREVPGPDGTTVKIPGRSFRLERGPSPATRPAPRLAEHTAQVLADWLP